MKICPGAGYSGNTAVSGTGSALPRLRRIVPSTVGATNARLPRPERFREPDPTVVKRIPEDLTSELDLAVGRRADFTMLSTTAPAATPMMVAGMMAAGPKMNTKPATMPSPTTPPNPGRATPASVLADPITRHTGQAGTDELSGRATSQPSPGRGRPPGSRAPPRLGGTAHRQGSPLMSGQTLRVRLHVVRVSGALGSQLFWRSPGVSVPNTSGLC